MKRGAYLPAQRKGEIMTPVPNLEVTVITGGDDLRDDSSATAWIMVIEGNESREYSTLLKSETEPGWGNDTTHGPIAWNLPPGIDSSSISRFGIRMQSHEGATETSDNWNVNSVVVTYPDGSGGQAVLVEQAGGPLVRLTGSEPAWETVLT
jgi:hypothetical protein